MRGCGRSSGDDSCTGLTRGPGANMGPQHASLATHLIALLGKLTLA